MSKFEGAQLRTVAGLRGQLKKALAKPAGAFRATFEDKILMRGGWRTSSVRLTKFVADLVFLRAWVTVPVPEYYTPVTNLLMADKVWTGMKTVGRLRFERQLAPIVKPDSLYRPIERRPWAAEPLHIPKNLQRQLPYAYKPKNVERAPRDEREALVKTHTARVLEPGESRVHELMTMIRTVDANRKREEKSTMVDRVKKHKFEQRLKQEKTDKRLRESTRRICTKLSKREQGVLKKAMRDVKKERR